MKGKSFEDKLFNQLDVSEMSELLKDYDVEIGEKTAQSIKSKAFEKVGLEIPNTDVKTKTHIGLSKTAKRITAIAACICIIAVSVTVGIMLNNSKPVQSVTTTERTTAKTDLSNPLMLAISKGDDSLIDSLLKNTIFLNDGVLQYAIDCISVLSYNTVSKIANAVYQTFGTTGLDPLVEKTLLGDSQGAIAELSKKDNAFTSYTDRLAFFFSVVFCNSDTVDCFVQKGADINSRDVSGNTVHQLAVKYGNEENRIYAEEHGGV
ncbi:MAG: ankyrin repeat domain-containing protein [Faecalibacterium sp.]|nr:ankyrin repeat domain-containing protein [Ruminococcus sp.]MCM1392052.1 ankyrin repeat domain-containing protein [Ruminococcus sp.]MCM1485829.1 ankyrin repeat domain-containing protein [Faecalibacterium sp.]